MSEERFLALLDAGRAAVDEYLTRNSIQDATRSLRIGVRKASIRSEGAAVSSRQRIRLNDWQLHFDEVGGTFANEKQDVPSLSLLGTLSERSTGGVRKQPVGCFHSRRELKAFGALVLCLIAFL